MIKFDVLLFTHRHTGWVPLGSASLKLISCIEYLTANQCTEFEQIQTNIDHSNDQESPPRQFALQAKHHEVDF